MFCCVVVTVPPLGTMVVWLVWNGIVCREVDVRRHVVGRADDGRRDQFRARVLQQRVKLGRHVAVLDLDVGVDRPARARSAGVVGPAGVKIGLDGRHGDQAEVDAELVHVMHGGGDELHLDGDLARGDVQVLDDLFDQVEPVHRGEDEQAVVALNRVEAVHAVRQRDRLPAPAAADPAAEAAAEAAAEPAAPEVAAAAEAPAAPEVPPPPPKPPPPKPGNCWACALALGSTERSALTLSLAWFKPVLPCPAGTVGC